MPPRILPHEKTPLILLSLAFFLFKTGLEIAGNLAEVIYFRRLGVNSLPSLYTVQPLAMVLVLVGFSLVADRLNRHKMLLILNLAFAAILVAAGFLILANWDGIYFLLYISQQIFFALLPLAFWLVCSDLFDIRQAKRLFVLITASGLVGALLGNVLTGVLAGILTPEETIILTSAFFIASAGFGLWLSRLGIAKSFVPPKVATDNSFAPILPLDLFKQPFIRVFSVLILITGLLEPVWRYELNLIANQSFALESTLIAFYGYFKGLATLAVILFQVFAAGRLVQKIGIPGAVSTHPLGLVGIMLLIAVFPTLPVAVIAVALLGIIRIGFDESGRKAIIGIYPLHERFRVSSFERQMMYFSIFLGGLLLMGAVNHLTLTQMNVISAGLAAAWLLFFARFRSTYAQGCLQRGEIPLAPGDLPAPTSNPLAEKFQSLLAAEPPARVAIQGAGLRDTKLNAAISQALSREEASIQIALRSSLWSVRQFAAVTASDGRVGRVFFEAVSRPSEAVSSSARGLLAKGAFRGRRVGVSIREERYSTTDPSRNDDRVSAQLDFAESLSAPEGFPQIQKLIAERRDAAAEAILLLLEGTYPPQKIHTAARMIRHAETRANGLEALDILLHRPQKNRLMLLFEAAYTHPNVAAQPLDWDALADNPDPEISFWAKVWNLRAGKGNYVARTMVMPSELRVLLAEVAFPPTGEEAMELVEKIDALRAAESFAALTETELRVLATCAHETHHDADEIIFEEGQRGSVMYIVLSGHVELASVEEKKTIQAVGPGGAFGEHALFTEEPYSLTAITVSETRLLALDRPTLLELMQYYPNLSVSLIQNLARRYEKASALLRSVWV